MTEPSSSPTREPRKQCCRNPWLVCLIASIFGMILPPLVGVSGTVFGMVNSFNELNENGESDPAELAENVSQSILTTAAGLVISLLFLILFIVSLVKVLGRRKTNQT